MLKLSPPDAATPASLPTWSSPRRTIDAHLRSIFTKLGIEADPNGNQRVLAALDWLSSQSQVPGPAG